MLQILQSGEGMRIPEIAHSPPTATTPALGSNRIGAT